MNIGAGRIVYQDFSRVTQAIRDGSFHENPRLCAAIDAARDRGGAVHVMGLLSPGGVHSHDDHFIETVKLAAERGGAGDAGVPAEGGRGSAALRRLGADGRGQGIRRAVLRGRAIRAGLIRRVARGPVLR